jgi:ppGpp synthetase/RelA/SpoT-type nucleotidyltranferase
VSDLIDLAGVRVALYFPGDTERTVNALKSILQQHKEPKIFPEGQRKKTREMRFSGYRATHLRLRVEGEDIHEDTARFFPVEIQIASLIMHAWSEVEHDLDYKHLDWTVSDLKLELLDQLNGLALAAEISLEQLQTARNQRMSRQQLNAGL